MAKFKTQMEAPLASKNKSSSLQGKELASGSLKTYRLTNQVEVLMAIEWIFERVEVWELDEVFGWNIKTSNSGSVKEEKRIIEVGCWVRLTVGLYWFLE